MNIKYRRLKGTRDIMLEEIERWRWCEGRWSEILARYGYGEIRTPIIEPTSLFLRTPSGPMRPNYNDAALSLPAARAQFACQPPEPLPTRVP